MATERESNGRTHEPDLREVTAQLDSLRDLTQVQDRAIRDILQERDRRTTEQFDAQKAAVFAALAAQEKLTQAAFSSAEKAIDKAEASQKAYNERSNEFRGQLDDQAKGFIPRAEADARDERTRESIDSVKAEITEIRKGMSYGGGERHGVSIIWVIAVAVAGFFLGLLNIAAIIWIGKH